MTGRSSYPQSYPQGLGINVMQHTQNMLDFCGGLCYSSTIRKLIKAINKERFKMNIMTITKADLEAELGFSITDEEYATAYYCDIDEEWTIEGEDGYPLCYCN